MKRISFILFTFLLIAIISFGIAICLYITAKDKFEKKNFIKNPDKIYKLDIEYIDHHHGIMTITSRSQENIANQIHLWQNNNPNKQILEIEATGNSYYLVIIRYKIINNN